MLNHAGKLASKCTNIPVITMPLNNSNGIAKISYKLAHLCPNPSIKLTTSYPSQSGHKNLVYSRKKTCIFRSSLLRNGKFLLGNPEFPIKPQVWYQKLCTFDKKVTSKSHLTKVLYIRNEFSYVSHIGIKRFPFFWLKIASF